MRRPRRVRTAGHAAGEEAELADFQPSGNQGPRPDLYEIENRAIDPDGLVLEAMRRLAPWAGRRLVDLGCGTGFWLAHYLGEADEVIGVEPDRTLLKLAQVRVQLTAARVLHGSAEHLPLEDASVNVVHARFAYFFPPGCDRGLDEVRRVLAPGGRLVVVDNDLRHGELAELLVASPWAAAQGRADTTDAWWSERGAERVEVMSQWRFKRRQDLEAVLGLELPPELAAGWLADHPSALSLSCGYVLFALGR